MIYNFFKLFFYISWLDDFADLFSEVWFFSVPPISFPPSTTLIIVFGFEFLPSGDFSRSFFFMEGFF